MHVILLHPVSLTNAVLHPGLGQVRTCHSEHTQRIGRPDHALLGRPWWLRDAYGDPPTLAAVMASSMVVRKLVSLLFSTC